MSHDALVPARLPIGTVTFLFTDIEGSTRLLQRLGGDYQGVLERHAAIFRQAVGEHEGVEVKTEGDAFFAVFRALAQGRAMSRDEAIECAWSLATSRTDSATDQ